MTINATASILLAMYIALAKKQLKEKKTVDFLSTHQSDVHVTLLIFLHKNVCF